MVIYSIGTSNREKEEFIDILKLYKIKKIIDVRRFPTSKFSYFKRENLKNILNLENIKYYYLGHILGGYRKQGYKEFTKTEEFKRGLDKIEEIAKNESGCCILCAELFPWKCHRRFITQALQTQRNYKIIHIIDKKRIWTPKL
jgi:uncharacterized protein (DUF488 family)